MNILMGHNYYRTRGGEDISFESEASLLESHGHTVQRYQKSNNIIDERQLLNKIRLAKNTIWSSDSYKEISQLIKINPPSIVHFQNIFPLLSPSVYYACKDNDIPVVQSLRNYRFICPSANLYRENKICTDCLNSPFSVPGIIHGCYHSSSLQTLLISSMIENMKCNKGLEKHVDIFIALTEFSRQVFIKAGFPKEKITVKPNFLPDPGKSDILGDYVLFIGRLTEEKGIKTLINAWKKIKNVPLLIIGDGPLINEIEDDISNMKISLIPQISYTEVINFIKNSRFVIFPSEWYEPFGRVVIESFACQKPVIASDLGGLKDLVGNNETGLLFSPGDSDDLIKKVDWLWNHSLECKQLGINARSKYESKYTPEVNYQKLISIYSSLLSK